jgi:hypothetical protein
MSVKAPEVDLMQASRLDYLNLLGKTHTGVLHSTERKACATSSHTDMQLGASSTASSANV